MKEECRIYVACHKPCNISTNEVYIPIHVGKALSSYSLDMIGDDIGDNISKKNNMYSELTGQYWVWKNVKESDDNYVGFCHYRRFFDIDVRKEDFAQYDVILCDPCYSSIKRVDSLKNYVIPEDIYILFQVVRKLSPEYYQDLLKYSNGHINYICNMFICRRKLFDAYAEWLFNILFECEKHIKLGPYSRQQRVMGYLAEFLMPVFFIHNKSKIKNVPMIREDGRYRLSLLNKIKVKLLDVLTYKSRYKVPYFDNSLVLSLKNDGVLV